MHEHAGTNNESRIARRAMIADQIEARGVHDPRVLSAMEAIPRERFVPADAAAFAYDDRALSIGDGQTISQPYMVGLMTAALRVGPDDRVLEVGTGSGYQAAVLAQLTDRLYTVERVASLLQSARKRLGELGVAHVRYRLSDGPIGWADEAPFDRIIVTAGSPRIPDVLVDQLAIGGRLVIPVGDSELQTLLVVERRDGRTIERSIIACRFVKLVGDGAWP